MLSGHEEHFRGVQGTAVCNVFGLTIAMCGANEAALDRAGITKYGEVNIHPGLDQHPLSLSFLTFPSFFLSFYLSFPSLSSLFQSS